MPAVHLLLQHGDTALFSLLTASFAPGPNCCCGNRESPALPQAAAAQSHRLPTGQICTQHLLISSSGPSLQLLSLDHCNQRASPDSVQQDHSPAGWICCGHEVCARAGGSLAGTDKPGVPCTLEGLIYLSKSPEGASPSLLHLARGRGTPLSSLLAAGGGHEGTGCSVLLGARGAATPPAQGMLDASSSTRGCQGGC